MFLSALSFALANLFVKKLEYLPAMEVVFFRCLVSSSFCLAGLRLAKRSFRGNNPKLLILRGIFGTTALGFFFLTLQEIPLASAMTIQYLAPIFTAIIGIFALRESVKPAQWFFYALAFGGVLIVEQFDARISYLYLGFGIFAAFCSGVAYNLVRTLRGREHPLVIVLYFQVIGVIAGLLFTIFDWRTPRGFDWLLLFLVGFFSQFGQVFLTNAFQKERAASVAIVNYTSLIYALLFGWFVFGEVQTLQSLSGMLLVVGSVILSVLYSKRRKDIENIESSIG